MESLLNTEDQVLKKYTLKVFSRIKLLKISNNSSVLNKSTLYQI